MAQTREVPPHPVMTERAVMQISGVTMATVVTEMARRPDLHGRIGRPRPLRAMGNP